jgi:hypothetical protein
VEGPNKHKQFQSRKWGQQQEQFLLRHWSIQDGQAGIMLGL